MKILIVDDNPLILKAVSKLLEKNGLACEITTAQSGAQALAVLEGTPQDIILLDLMLPDTDGLDLLRQVRSYDRDVQVLMFTAWKDDQSLTEAFAAGANDYLSKPLEQVEFIARLKMAMRVRQETLERQKTEEKLRYRLQLEKLVASISGRFIRLEAGQVDAGINKALEEVGEFVRADRSYYFMLYNNGTRMDNVHEWCAPGIEPQIDKLKSISTKDLPWFTERLRKLQPIHIPDIAALPPEAATEKEHFGSQGIQSLLVIPMVYGSSLMGFLGFDAVRAKKSWQEEEIILLRFISEIFANALVRRDTERELRLERDKAQVYLNILKESQQRLADIINFLPDATFAIDLKGRVIIWNKAMEEMSGVPAGQMLGKGNHEYALPFYGERRPVLIDMVLDRSLKECRGRYLLVQQAGRHSLIGEAYSPLLGIYMWIKATALFDSCGNLVGAIETIRDITERRQAEDKLKYLSLHDQLTGVYNRTYFEEELLRLQNSRSYPVTIISADLDGLKLVNDTFGHKAGDMLLKAGAQLLKTPLRKADFLARIGGDEFIIVLPATGEKAAGKVIARLRQVLKEYNDSQPEIPLSISLGAATALQGQSLDETVIKADNRMYLDKLARRRVAGLHVEELRPDGLTLGAEAVVALLKNLATAH